MYSYMYIDSVFDMRTYEVQYHSHNNDKNDGSNDWDHNSVPRNILIITGPGPRIIINI